MFESELLIFAWGLALVGAVAASLVVRAVDGVVHGFFGREPGDRRLKGD